MIGRTSKLAPIAELGRQWRSRALVRDAAWVATGQILSSVGVLLGTRLLTEFISPPVFGATTLLLGVAALAAAVTCSPILQAAVRYYPEAVLTGTTDLLRREISRSLALVCVGVVSVVLLCGAGWSVIHRASLAVPAVLSVLTVVEISKSYNYSLLSAGRRQKRYAIWVIGESTLRPALALAAVHWLGESVTTVLLAYLGASVLLLAALRLPTANAPSNASPAEHQEVRRSIRAYATPLLPIAVVGWISGASDRYIVGYFLGVSQAGIYAASYGIVSRGFALIGGILINTIRPVYFNAVVEKDGERARRLHRSWVTAAAVLMVGATLGVTLLRNVIATLFLARGYRASGDLMPWFALGAGLLVLAQSFNTANLAHHRNWAVTRSEIVAATSSLVVGIPLTAHYGLMGAATAVPIYFGIQLLFAWWPTRLDDVRGAYPSAVPSTQLAPEAE